MTESTSPSVDQVSCWLALGACRGTATDRLVGVPPALRCEIFPDDLDATVAFYVDVLGFELRRDERYSDPPYVALQRGEARVGAAARPRVAVTARRPPTGVELVLEVEDVHADFARVTATGWPVDEDLADQPWGLPDFRVVDPNGYYWRLTSP